MLVVVAIIGILASLLLAPLSSAKARARTVVCKNNLRQLGLATTLYVEDDGRYPLYGVFLPTGTDCILNLISPYLGARMPPLEPNAGLLKKADPLGDMPYHCPEQIYGRPRYLDYGYNVAGVDLSNGFTNKLGLHGGIREGAVVSPAGMVALTDGLGVSEGAPGPVIMTGPYPFAASKGRTYSPGSPHFGRGNLLFCDLHIEFERGPAMCLASEPLRRRWNNDNEPHPELWPDKSGL